VCEKGRDDRRKTKTKSTLVVSVGCGEWGESRKSRIGRKEEGERDGIRGIFLSLIPLGPFFLSCAIHRIRGEHELSTVGRN